MIRLIILTVLGYLVNLGVKALFRWVGIWLQRRSEQRVRDDFRPFKESVTDLIECKQCNKYVSPEGKNQCVESNCPL